MSAVMRSQTDSRWRAQRKRKQRGRVLAVVVALCWLAGSVAVVGDMAGWW